MSFIELQQIAERAERAGLQLSTAAQRRIAAHATAVIENNARLKLTTITEPDLFLERHIGESLEGAALLDAKVEGTLLDLGSGNGFPALPILAAYPALRGCLVDAAKDKSAFLQELLETEFGGGEMIAKQIQRVDDFDGLSQVRLLTTRAMGNWERILPRLATLLAPNGIVLLWAGASVAEVADRKAWKRYSLVARHALPGRQQSWIWAFKPNPSAC